jgi:plasmid segregation protein ParM
MSQIWQERFIAGSDSGNDSNKISVINEKGNIESSTISSVIAPAPTSKAVDLGRDKRKGTDKVLHVYIESDALPSNKKSSYYYVGEYAKTKKDVVQPHYYDKAGGSESQQKSGNEIHAVTTLTALALKAWEKGLDKATVDLSVGIPIREYKDTEGELLEKQYKGKHLVRSVDGIYAGEEVILNIENVFVYVEGVTSYMGITINMKDGDLEVTSEAEKIGEEFGVADLGAGTLDAAVYNEYGLDSEKSDNEHIGTNKYIDEIIKEISNAEIFEDVRNEIPDTMDKTPYRTREEFIEKVIKPVVDKMISDKEGEYQPKFKVEWLFSEDTETVTKIILKHMKAYSEEALGYIKKFRAENRIKNMVLVGGGLLFAYYYFKQEKHFIMPANLEQSAYFTSRAYAIKNYLEHLED